MMLRCFLSDAHCLVCLEYPEENIKTTTITEATAATKVGTEGRIKCITSVYVISLCLCLFLKPFIGAFLFYALRHSHYYCWCYCCYWEWVLLTKLITNRRDMKKTIENIDVAAATVAEKYEEKENYWNQHEHIQLVTMLLLLFLKPNCMCVCVCCSTRRLILEYFMLIILIFAIY